MKPYKSVWGLVVLIGMMLLLSKGELVFANQKSLLIESKSSALHQTPQYAEHLPDLTYELIEPGVGWLATTNQIFWTNSNGTDWTEITPAGLTKSVANVEFLDSKIGWVVGLDHNVMPATIEYFLTSDGGSTWQDKSTEIQKAISQLVYPLSDTIYAQLAEDGQGWLLLKLATGVNFSLGVILYTSDGGDTWELKEVQSGEPFRFLDSNNGYQLAAHASGLLRTENGGKSWQSVALPMAGLRASDQIQPGLPLISEDGRLVVLVHTYHDLKLTASSVLESDDNGKTWLETKTALTPSPAVLRGEPLLVTLSTTGQLTQWQPVIFSPTNGEQEKGTSAAIALEQLSLTSITSPDGQNAWGLFSGGNCVDEEKSVRSVCQQGQVLGATSDSGKTWNLMHLPAEVAVLAEIKIDAPEFNAALQSNTTTVNTTNWQLIQAHGFDTCADVNMTRMANWRASSPYSVYGLYIGGSMAYCPNTVFNATSLRLLFNAGWRFIPTWVGPQAPCTNFKTKFSLDPVVAYNEGVTNANQAVEALKIRGMTNPDGSGSVIYYDLERFPDDAACKAAARSFLRGWTTRLQQLGNKSGLYATSRNLNTNQLYNLVPSIDVVWIAEWYATPYFRNWVTVYDVDYLSDSYWANHQRVYQYAGGHSETWGGTTMSIDSDVIDGIVAVPYSSDITLPVSQATLDGTSVTTGWYKSAVTVTLKATDNISGINAIYYNLNNGDWKKYTGPFSVSTNQTHILQYRAVDGVYNWETPKQTTFKIDTTPPGFPTGLKWRCAYPGLKQAFCNDESFSWNAATDNLSGLKETYIYWGTNANGTSTNLAGSSFNAAPIADRTSYYLRFRTMDLAGNLSIWRTLYSLSYDTRFTQLRFFPLVAR